MSETTEFPSVSCPLNVPFEWQVIAEGDDIASAHEGNNFSRLQVIQGLEEVSSESFDEFPGLASEIQRIDFKMNVLLELVGVIATKELMIPPSVSILLSSSAVQWQTPQSLKEGVRLQLELFLEMRFPFSLVFSGRVETVTQAEGENSVVVNLDPQSERVQELLDKYIFRCHRRHIARMKRDKATHGG